MISVDAKTKIQMFRSMLVIKGTIIVLTSSDETMLPHNGSSHIGDCIPMIQLIQVLCKIIANYIKNYFPVEV